MCFKSRASSSVGRAGSLAKVNGNPLEDITVTERVSFVILGGEVFKRAQ